MKIAFFSFADIDNFGDILFSHIFKMEMESRLDDVEIDFYSPTSFKVEGLDYIAYNRKKISPDYDALIIFGGEIIHLYDQRTWIPIYNKNNQILESELPSDIVFDWVNIDKPFKAWISVGVRPIAPDQSFTKFQNAIEKLDFISTRGNISKKILEKLNLEFNNPKIEITPDLGWLFPKLLDNKNSRGEYFKKYIDSDLKYMVFQINNISSEEAREISNYLGHFQKETGLKVVLLPVIRPWEDYKYLKMINSFSENSFLLLPNNLNILEIADILVHSNLVLCSSLHAAITSLSAGNPAGIINKWNGTKLQDLFGHQYRLHMVKHEIQEIPILLKQLYEEMEEGEINDYLSAYSQFNKLRLGNVFDNLILRIKTKMQSE